MAETGNFRLIM